MEGVYARKNPYFEAVAGRDPWCGCNVRCFVFIYFLLVMVFQQFFNENGQYDFMGWLRVAFGLLMMAICVGLNYCRMPELMKASALTTGFVSMLIAISVQLYRIPIISIVISALAILLGLMVVHRLKKAWYFYYGILLTILFMILYM